MVNHTIMSAQNEGRTALSPLYGRAGVREVGYDNERGKGDHRHFQGAETPYTFSTVERLITDFWSDVRALRGTT